MVEASRFVVDVSVATKWHLRDEEHADQALRLLKDFRDGQVSLLAPDHILYEVSSALLKAARRKRITHDQARQSISLFFSWGLPTIRASAGQNLLAYDKAVQYGCSFYDALYVAVAESSQCLLITADDKLRNALERGFEYYLWIEDY